MSEYVWMSPEGATKAGHIKGPWWGGVVPVPGGGVRAVVAAVTKVGVADGDVSTWLEQGGPFPPPPGMNMLGANAGQTAATRFKAVGIAIGALQQAIAPMQQRVVEMREEVGTLLALAGQLHPGGVTQAAMEVEP